uniref:BON1-associated protein 2-like n=1 Tax=Nicotiana sylvestris TaxID=4096 RepID=A0A1U7VS59_NICSY|nr:PREDICTED: BON1-associated protein 2-like [Nicotiana sylvestris]
MEITIISAQGLKNNTTWWRLRPFATVSTVATASISATTTEVYTTSVDEKGGENPKWGDKFHLSLDASLFLHGHLCIYLQIYSKNFFNRRSELGWCMIPAADVFDRLLPTGFVRQFSYRLRNKDGSRGHGVVNISVKMEASFLLGMHPQRSPLMAYLPEVSDCSPVPVVGIPVTSSSANI